MNRIGLALFLFLLSGSVLAYDFSQGGYAGRLGVFRGNPLSGMVEEFIEPGIHIGQGPKGELCFVKFERSMDVSPVFRSDGQFMRDGEGNIVRRPQVSVLQFAAGPVNPQKPDDYIAFYWPVQTVLLKAKSELSKLEIERSQQRQWELFDDKYLVEINMEWDVGLSVRLWTNDDDDEVPFEMRDYTCLLKK